MEGKREDEDPILAQQRREDATRRVRLLCTCALGSLCCAASTCFE
jgi:hypothetical protein